MILLKQATRLKLSAMAFEFNYKDFELFYISFSFKEKENLSPEENELIALRKELQHLRMENDILKQAALIMGRK